MASQISSDASAPNSDTFAVIEAKIGGHTFVCHIDSGADIVAISEPIVNFLCEKGFYLPTIRPSSTELVQAFDGLSVKCHGRVEISPILQTAAGPCGLRNIKAQIMPDRSTYTKPGTVCRGETFLENPFLIRSSLDRKNFVAKNIERHSSIDFGEVHAEETSTKIGKLGLKVIYQRVDADASDSVDDAHHLHSSHLCSMMGNGDFLLKDGDKIDYKNVEVGEQDTEELESTIQNTIDRAAKKLPSDLRPTLQDMVTIFKNTFCIRLGKDPLVSISPMFMEREDFERPIKAC